MGFFFFYYYCHYRETCTNVLITQVNVKFEGDCSKRFFLYMPHHCYWDIWVKQLSTDSSQVQSTQNFSFSAVRDTVGIWQSLAMYGMNRLQRDTGLGEHCFSLNFCHSSQHFLINHTIFFLILCTAFILCRHMHRVRLNAFIFFMQKKNNFCHFYLQGRNIPYGSFNFIIHKVSRVKVTTARTS